MATVINETKNTASVTNQAFSSADLIWNDEDFPWGSAPGTWNNPYSLTNETKNTASVTNEAKS